MSNRPSSHDPIGSRRELPDTGKRNDARERGYAITAGRFIDAATGEMIGDATTTWYSDGTVLITMVGTLDAPNSTASDTAGPSTGSVTALQVKEGSFALKTRSIPLRGQGAGMDAFIVFLPGKNAPNSKAIRMIQVAKMTDPDGRPITWSGGEAERMKAMTKAGFFVDILYAKGTSSPYYDDFARGRIGSKAGDDAQSAAISDRPFMAAGRGAFIAETAVVDVETGHYYGSVRWGFSAADDTATLMQPVATDTPSQDLLGALARFNWLYGKK